MQTPKSPDGIRHSRCVVIRNTTTQLRDTTRKTFTDWIPFGEWREHPLECRLRFADVDCEVLFRALDRPQDVRNLLSLELTFAYCNEMRELAKPVFDGLTGRVGRFPRRQDVPVYWSGIWGDTNPWHAGHWLSKMFQKPEGSMRLFRQPGGRDPKAENLENLKPGYYQSLLAGKDAEWVRVYVDGLEGTSDKGSIYGEWLDALANRSTQWGQDKGSEVFTSWDLGLADATSIWWWRLAGSGVELLDFYENQQKGLEHYFEQLDSKAKEFGWKYVKHWLPHDADNKTLATQVSVLNQFHARYGAALTAIGPDLFVKDGIAAARWLLEQPNTRFHPRCSTPRPGTELSGLDLLRAYRFQWDPQNQVYSKNPLHDFASHCADAFRYVAVVARAAQNLTRKPTPDSKPPLAVIDGHTNLTLDELIEQNEQWLRQRERR